MYNGQVLSIVMLGEVQRQPVQVKLSNVPNIMGIVRLFHDMNVWGWQIPQKDILVTIKGGV
jgi:hypothetical protein